MGAGRTAVDVVVYYVPDQQRQVQALLLLLGLSGPGTRQPQAGSLGPAMVLPLQAAAIEEATMKMIPQTPPSMYRPSSTSRPVAGRPITCSRCSFPGPHTPGPGGRLQPVGLWDLRTHATPAGMLRRGEV